MTAQRRWLDWEPSRILASTLEPLDRTDKNRTQEGFVGFVGRFEDERKEVSCAVRRLVSAGGQVRLGSAGKLEIISPTDAAVDSEAAVETLERCEQTAVTLFRALARIKEVGVKRPSGEGNARVVEIPRRRDGNEVRQALRDLGYGRFTVVLTD